MTAPPSDADCNGLWDWHQARRHSKQRRGERLFRSGVRVSSLTAAHDAFGIKQLSAWRDIVRRNEAFRGQ